MRITSRTFFPRRGRDRPRRPFPSRCSRSGRRRRIGCRYPSPSRTGGYPCSAERHHAHAAAGSRDQADPRRCTGRLAPASQGRGTRRPCRPARRRRPPLALVQARRDRGFPSVSRSTVSMMRRNAVGPVKARRRPDRHDLRGRGVVNCRRRRSMLVQTALTRELNFVSVMMSVEIPDAQYGRAIARNSFSFYLMSDPNAAGFAQCLPCVGRWLGVSRDGGL